MLLQTHHYQRHINAGTTAHLAHRPIIHVQRGSIVAVTHPAVVHALEDSTSNIRRRRVAARVLVDTTALQALQAITGAPQGK